MTGGATQYGTPTADRKFLVGTNHTIYNAVHYENGYISGWQSLGGWGKGGVWVKATSGPKNITVYTTGSDNNRWCKKLTNGSWGGWYRC